MSSPYAYFRFSSLFFLCAMLFIVLRVRGLCDPRLALLGRIRRLLPVPFLVVILLLFFVLAAILPICLRVSISPDLRLTLLGIRLRLLLVLLVLLLDGPFY
jgi:hypothetical protein